MVQSLLTYLLELIGPKWRHILARRMGVYEALHDAEWLGDYCCAPEELTEALTALENCI
jgi:hypothetical protein